MQTIDTSLPLFLSQMWLFPNSPYFTRAGGAERRQLLRYLLAAITERESLQAFESTPITDAVTGLMDSIVGDICSYVSLL